VKKLVLVLLGVVLASGCTSPPKPPAPTVSAACARGRTVVVVRHAEKASAEKDTPLSERGRARANTLASMLAHAGVTRLVATQYKRTQETLAPLGERLGVPVDVRDASATRDLVEEVRHAPDGSFTVVATHSNVIPFVVKELTGNTLRGVTGDALAEDDYGRVLVIAEPCGAERPSLVELSSGE
jgi:broad specificity phosphatase PhoE